jgi:hypothetical protein
MRICRALVATLATAVSMWFASAGVAQAGGTDSEARVAAAKVSLIGTVTAVDAVQRTLSVKSAQGVERSYSVDPAVHNLENVKVGDRVRLDYLVAVAVVLRKGDASLREKVETEAAGQAPAGGMPAAAAGRRTTWVADVVSVDRQRQHVRLKGPEGRVADFKVADKAGLKEVRAGDQVVAVVHEALAVGVTPAAKAVSGK